MEFGALGVGTVSPEHAVWLRNLSAAPLIGVMPRVVGGRFEARHNCPAVLAPGAVQSDALTWGSASPAVTGLAATGTAGPVAVLSTGTTDLQFGSADVGAVALRRVNLINAGTAQATLGVHTFTGPTAGAFSSDGGCASGTALMPGTACAIEVRWRAGAAAGTRRGSQCGGQRARSAARVAAFRRPAGGWWRRWRRLHRFWLRHACRFRHHGVDSGCHGRPDGAPPPPSVTT